MQVTCNSAQKVSGMLGQNVTVPCRYSIKGGVMEMCWGRGECPAAKCTQTVISSDGNRVKYKKSDKYGLFGNLQEGDVSLIILHATEEDSGTYCCRVEIPGWFNDHRHNTQLIIEKAPATTTSKPVTTARGADTVNTSKGQITTMTCNSAQKVSGMLGQNVTVSCRYSIKGGVMEMCWGRGECPAFKCPQTIISSDGNRVNHEKSDKYGLFGNLQEGDVSLTILHASEEDSGTYCCRVEIPGWFNDYRHNTQLIIEKACVALVNGHEVLEGHSITLPCGYSVRRNGLSAACWGRGCGTMWCSDEIIQTDGNRVTSKLSERYRLNGNILDGNLALTILNTGKADSGSYCCRVDIAGYFNDLKVSLTLKVVKGEEWCFAVGEVGHVTFNQPPPWQEREEPECSAPMSEEDGPEQEPEDEGSVHPQPKSGEVERPQPKAPLAGEEYLLVSPPLPPSEGKELLLHPPRGTGPLSSKGIMEALPAVINLLWARDGEH
ncbi:UNVERIFIED_CONTAM: hypothetical protein FKN15_063257 [Acipenser sinensis]